MKTTFLHLICSILCCFPFILTAQIYVNENAAGMGTGDKWTDAYTDLQTAIEAAEEGDEIWVAAGTYKPDTLGGSTGSRFLINKNLKLYGGFAGTEDSLDERGDPFAYPTILSGDLEGDDVIDNYSTNRGDNVTSIMVIYNQMTNETVIDGFIFEGGHAGGGVTNISKSGGAIYTSGAPIIRLCAFRQNFANQDGGAVAVIGPLAKGTIIEDCHFEKNRADNYGGGMAIISVATSLPGTATHVKNCSFLSNLNRNGRGGALAIMHVNTQVEHCSFTNNHNEEQGGAFWIFHQGGSNYNVELEECSFEGNDASFGGGFYYLNISNNSRLSFKNCEFTGNQVFDQGNGWGQGGGGLCVAIGEQSSNGEIIFDHCTFDNNVSSVSGGGLAVYNQGTNNQFTVKNIAFTSNEAVYHGGGLQFTLDESSDQSTVLVDSCSFSLNDVQMWTGSGLRALLLGKNIDFTVTNSEFVQNNTGLGGAAAVFGFLENASGKTSIENCTFRENTGDYHAGLSIGSGTDAGFFEHTIKSCSFFDNVANYEGGGMDVWSEVPTRFLVEDCLFDGNTGIETGGGLLVANTDPGTESTIRNCIWRNNFSQKGAAIGAIPFTEDPEDFSTTMDASILFENCLIYDNPGDTAAIYLKQTGNVKFLNTTVAHNSAGGLALDSLSAVTLQNTILYNPDGKEYEDLTPTSVFTSLGGNLIRDNSMSGLLLSYDQEEKDPLFIDPAMGNFHVQDNSPSIDNGIDLGGLSEFDLEGNPRVVACVDVGAYESATIVSTACLTEIRETSHVYGVLGLSPNPAGSSVLIDIPESGPLDISLFDLRGQQVLQISHTRDRTIDVQSITPGIYTMRIIAAEQIYSGKLIRK